MSKWNINWTRSCSDIVAFACVILSLLLEVRITLRLLTQELVHDCDGLPVDARSWYMISGDAKSWVVIVCIYSLSYCTIVKRMIVKVEMCDRRPFNYGFSYNAAKNDDRSASRATAAPQGGRTGRWTGRGGGRTRGRYGDQGNGRIDGQGSQIGGQGSEVNDGVDGVPDFSTIIAQQNQNGDAINDNIWDNVRNVIENNDHRGCTYKEFLACNPKEYDGKGGAILYTRWIEKMESVQDMSGCRDNQKVKYTARSFVGMSWEDFKTLTREEFCLSNEMKKLETELWNHAMVRAGHAAYTDRFHELARLIRGMVAAKEPMTIRKAMQIAGTLTNEAIRNGSLKKKPKKRGNEGEPSKDRNGGMITR
ncbi:hypothetical protein Tco_0744550 [Tanacetum coccineum]